MNKRKTCAHVTMAESAVGLFGHPPIKKAWRSTRLFPVSTFLSSLSVINQGIYALLLFDIIERLAARGLVLLITGHLRILLGLFLFIGLFDLFVRGMFFKIQLILVLLCWSSMIRAWRIPLRFADLPFLGIQFAFIQRNIF